MSSQPNNNSSNSNVPAGDGRILPNRWRNEFPYHWDADDLISRRQMLQFTVITSGAIFGGTTLLSVLNLLTQKRSSGTAKPIIAANQVQEGQPVYFNYPSPDDQAVLLKLPNNQFVAYSQKCTHLSCSVYYQTDSNHLYCPCHDGVFDIQTGEPIAGPPQRRLPRITLRQENGTLIAEDLVP